MTAGAELPEGEAVLFDGVGVLRRGDLCLVVYQKAARIERTRWLFDSIDTVLARTDGDIMGFLIVLPTSDPPDGATRQENLARIRRIGPRLRCLVTTPIGNAFKIGVVRTVLRGLNTMLGYAGTRFVTDTVEEGLTRLLEAKSALTPTADQILLVITTLYVALGEPEPRFPKVRPGHGPSMPPR
ncbi:MAG TPA: hypothetical protein VGK73_18740 [Polyangiaceae bacterium]